MLDQASQTSKHVGPILSSGPWLERMLAAIEDSNDNVTVIDRGSYCRVMVQDRCILTRDAFAKHLEGDFSWNEILNLVMPAFAGKLHIEEEKIEWRA